MDMVGRNPLQLRRRRQARAWPVGEVSMGLPRGQRSLSMACSAQSADPVWHALRHPNFHAMLVGCKHRTANFTKQILVHVKKTRVTELQSVRMGMDKWRHRLQGDKEPEQQ